MLMPWTLAPADVDGMDHRRQFSCSLGVVAVRRPSHRLGGLGVGRILLKRLGGGNLQASLGMQNPNPMKSKTFS